MLMRLLAPCGGVRWACLRHDNETAGGSFLRNWLGYESHCASCQQSDASWIPHEIRKIDVWFCASYVMQTVHVHIHERGAIGGARRRRAGGLECSAAAQAAGAPLWSMPTLTRWRP